jgi:isoprenylcysteine carboxyl methyltransferase (ICMT) family protein YpbQ
MERRESPLLFVLYFLAYLSVLVRMILNGEDTGFIQPPAYGLMAGFLALSIVQSPLGRRWPPSRHITLALQALIVIALLLTSPHMSGPTSRGTSTTRQPRPFSA